jgi:hypothetical protein
MPEKKEYTPSGPADNLGGRVGTIKGMAGGFAATSAGKKKAAFAA